MRDDNLQLQSDFSYEQFGPAGAAEALPVTLPSGTVFVSTISGLSGAVTFSGGSTGYSFAGAGSVVTLSVSNAATARSAIGAAASGSNSDITKLLGLNNGLRFLGRTSSAADPTTTELPVDKDLAIHENTGSGSIFLAFNKAGVILKVQLA